MFDKQSLLSMFKPKVVPVDVVVEGEDTQHVFVKQLSANQVFKLQEMQKQKGADNKSFALYLLSEALCDENGQSALTADEAKQLLGMQIKGFNALVGAVAEAVGLNATPPDKPGNASEANP